MFLKTLLRMWICGIVEIQILDMETSDLSESHRAQVMHGEQSFILAFRFIEDLLHFLNRETTLLLLNLEAEA